MDRYLRMLWASMLGLIVVTVAAMVITLEGYDGFFLVFMFPLFLWPLGLRH